MRRVSVIKSLYIWMIAVPVGLLGLTLIGSQPLSLSRIWHVTNSLDRLIWLDIRLPRVLFAWAVGGGLALAGAVYQVVLRNDLASPYTLGIASGGALGAVIAIKSGLVLNVVFFSTTALFSIAGSLTAIGLIMFIARYWQQAPVYSMILLGVALSFFFSAVNMLLHYLADFTETFKMMRWVMGALDVAGWSYPLTATALTLTGALFFLRRYRHFNVLVTGEELAKSKGVDVTRLQKQALTVGAVMTGFFVAMAGPVGFVGLLTPHIIRMIFGGNHRYVFGGSVLFGGLFLAVCDTLARTIIAPAELPVGVVTAFIGGPFFVYLLIRRSRPR